MALVALILLVKKCFKKTTTMELLTVTWAFLTCYTACRAKWDVADLTLSNLIFKDLKAIKHIKKCLADFSFVLKTFTTFQNTSDFLCKKTTTTKNTNTETHIAIFIVIFLWELTSTTQISKYLTFLMIFKFHKMKSSCFYNSKIY